MGLHIHIQKVHLLVFVVFLSLFGVFYFGVAVDESKAWHPLQQIARNSTDTSSVDSTGSGIIDYAENLDSSTGASEVNNNLDMMGNNLLNIGWLAGDGGSIEISDTLDMDNNNIEDVGQLEAEKIIVKSEGILIGTQGESKPNCDSSNRGLIWIDGGSSWEGDNMELCLRDGNNNYQWKVVASASW